MIDQQVVPAHLLGVLPLAMSTSTSDTGDAGDTSSRGERAARSGEGGTTRTTRESSKAPASVAASALSSLSLAIKKPFLSATTLLSDSSLRKKSAAMLSQQTNVIISPLKAGLTTLFDGPRQVQSTLTRLQKEYSQKRMDVLLEKKRDEHQDVQIGFLLYEDAPQELRARLWMAVLGGSGGALVRAYGEARSEVDEVGEVGEAGDLATTGQSSLQEIYAETKDQSMMVPWNTKKEEYRNVLMKAIVDVAWPPGGQDAEGADAEGADAEGADGDDAPRSASTSAAAASASTAVFPSSSPSSPSSCPPAATTSSSPGAPPVNSQHDYRTLLQISIGQEDVDDIISRDIHRTFPEHPLFGFKQGQESLFNLLKAYSLHDLEVGYCQGMAFVAGILLMYVPEEEAFAIFCRLMQGLRAMYLPEMMGLKQMLGSFDELLGRYLPTLKEHLEAHGVASLLYCTQWFLSIFACPFPVSFCARIIDVMLLQGGGQAILLRTALAIMCESEAELLALDDFEALLVHLKVDPLTWNINRLRRVLNASFSSPISDAEVAAVVAAVDDRLRRAGEGGEAGNEEGGGEGGGEGAGEEECGVGLPLTSGT